MTETVMATVIARQRCNDTIWRYTLKPDRFISYQAGQYLQLQFADSQYFFSIANADLGSGCYELHIRHPREPHKNEALMTHLAIEARVAVSLPLGHCGLNHLHPQKPILFLAAGTGFAPIRAMLEQLIAQKDPRPFELYWGVHAQDDFYDADAINHWQQSLSHFCYYPHMTSVTHTSLIAEVMAQHPSDLQDWQIVMAGPFDLMYTMRDALILAGVAANTLFSDAFEFE